MRVEAYPPQDHRYYGKYPWGDEITPIKAMGLFEGAKHVCGLCLFRVELYHQGVNVQALGIGGVWTDPEWRRKGLAGVLLRQAISWGIEQDYGACILFSKPRGLYRTLGFHRIGKLDEQEILVLELAPLEIKSGDWRRWPEVKF